MRTGVRRAVSIAAAAFAVAAAPALAAPAPELPVTAKKPKPPKLLIRSASVTTTADGQLISSVASCPTGAKALGGGFQSSLFGTSTATTDVHQVYESRRISIGQWRVSAARDALGAGAGLTLTTFVYCKRIAGKFPEAAGSVTVPGASAGPLGTATATCPDGRKAISGGFGFNAPKTADPEDEAGLEDSYRSAPGSWSAALRNSGASPRTLTAYAYCAKGKAAVARVGSALLPAGGTGSAVTAGCPAKTAPIGGGWRSGGQAALGGGSQPVTSRAAGRLWESSAIALGATTTLTALAYCS